MKQINWIKSSLLTLSLAGIIVSSGCKKEFSDNRKIDATNLYTKSLLLIQNYIDSLENSNDSVEVKRIAEKFDSKFTALNYEFPPETDLKMTEESNDSIQKMLLLLVETRKKKLRDLGHISADSIPSNEIQALKDSSVNLNSSQSVRTSISQSAQLK